MGVKIPLGYRKCEDLSASIGLDDVSFVDDDSNAGIPAGAQFAFIQCLGQNVRWRDDGGDAAADEGHQLLEGDHIVYDGPLWRLRFIEETAGAELLVSYYKV